MDTEKNGINVKVSRPWGFYTNINRGAGYLIKIIHVNPGGKLSVQSHNHRSEHWVVLNGSAKVILNKQIITLKKGGSMDIPLKAVHSLQNQQESDLEVLEIQYGDILSEDDIVRYEDIYGRV